MLYTVRIKQEEEGTERSFRKWLGTWGINAHRRYVESNNEEVWVIICTYAAEREAMNLMRWAWEIMGNKWEQLGTQGYSEEPRGRI